MFDNTYMSCEYITPHHTGELRPASGSLASGGPGSVCSGHLNVKQGI
jgi:hypothetical protein